LANNYNGINVYKNSIKPKFCNTLINLYKQHRNSPVLLQEDYGLNKNVKCNYVMTTQFKSIDKKLLDVLYGILDKAIIDNPYLHCTGDSGYQLREVHGATKLHIDNVIDPTNPNRSRTVSIIIALNSDYDGGIFNFPFQNFQIKLKQGDAIVFPAAHTHPHEVSSPKNGTLRYTINTWLFG